MSFKLDDVFQEWTSKVEDGSVRDMPRNSETVELQPEQCRPGVFPAPFTITVRELSTREEMAIIKATKGNDGARLGLMMAQRSIYSFNGEPVVKTAHREWLWEALGQRGRNIVSTHYARVMLGEETEEGGGEEGNG
jgi:hypothetical protein